jgi:hypothetical protein
MTEPSKSPHTDALYRDQVRNPMAKTAEQWSDAYYEQQALHTEETGILGDQVRRLNACINELFERCIRADVMPSDFELICLKHGVKVPTQTIL